MAELTGVRDALLAVEAAFAQAARRRVGIIRVIAKVPLAPAQEDDRGRLVAALLRAEAADADAAATAGHRLRATVAQARLADEERERLGAPAIDALVGDLRASSAAAADASAQAVRNLTRRAPAEVAEALRDYVAALGALHRLDPTEPDSAFAAALAATEAAEARLEAAIAAVSG